MQMVTIFIDGSISHRCLNRKDKVRNLGTDRRFYNIYNSTPQRILMKFFLVAFLLFFTIHLVAQTVVITNASIVDASAVDPIKSGSIIIVDGRITAIDANLTIPEGARTIDAHGKFVVPGLWDMHAHLAAITPVGLAPERYVGYGVLNIRDMGGRTEELFSLRATIQNGGRTGPEIVLAGPTLNSEQPADFHRLVKTDAQARAAVRELKARGVDFIKIHRAINQEVFDAIADESRRQGLPFTGHVPLVMGWIDASNAGMRTIEHIQTIFENIQPDPRLMRTQFNNIADRLNGPLGDSIFRVMKANHTFFDPTLIGYESSFSNVTPDVAERRRVAYGKMKLIAARAAQAGVPIITGTDVLERHGDLLLRELETLVEIGLTPQQVLEAATVISAEAAQHPDLGRVVVGAPASLIIVDRNPLLNIRNLRGISTVVLRKQLFNAEQLARLRE